MTTAERADAASEAYAERFPKSEPTWLPQCGATEAGTAMTANLMESAVARGRALRQGEIDKAFGFTPSDYNW